jgi:hypothetical protein
VGRWRDERLAALGVDDGVRGVVLQPAGFPPPGLDTGSLGATRRFEFVTIATAGFAGEVASSSPGRDDHVSQGYGQHAPAGHPEWLARALRLARTRLASRRLGQSAAEDDADRLPANLTGRRPCPWGHFRECQAMKRRILRRADGSGSTRLEARGEQARAQAWNTAAAAMAGPARAG